jgi:nucleoside-diphosphate-sugar epimerase
MQGLILGCGYLGRRVAAIWNSAGHTVYGLTRSPQHADTFRSLGIEPIVGDVLDPATLRPLPSADVVLYAVGHDKQASPTKQQVSVHGLENALRQIAARSGRILYVSSTSIYGQNGGEWVDETSPCHPTTQDGQICLQAEEIARSAGAIVLRFSGLYGPGRLLRRSEALRSGLPIAANPDGYLNLIHVDDGARVVAAMADDNRHLATLLVTDDQPILRRLYYERLADLLGAPPPKFQTSQDDATALNKRCSNARLRAQFGKILRFPTFDVGLADAITNEGVVPPP